MITTKSFITDTLNTVDAVIGNYVNVVYTHFVQANSGVITLLFTTYIIFLGYRFLNYDQQVNVSYVVRHLTVMLIVYAMLMSWHLYELFVYNIFTNEPGHISQLLIGSTEHVSQGETIAQVLDKIYESIINASIGFFAEVNFSSSGMAFLLYGIVVFIIGSMLCISALVLFVYAKMMMAVSLALGPLFISFLLWNSTKQMFAAWLRKLVTIALIPIITSAVLVLMLSVINVTLPNINQPISNMQFYGIVPFLGLSMATILILSQVYQMASALGGGITIANIVNGLKVSGAAGVHSAYSRTVKKTNMGRNNKKGGVSGE